MYFYGIYYRGKMTKYSQNFKYKTHAVKWYKKTGQKLEKKFDHVFELIKR